MIDSEIKEIRKRKIKRILLWTCGIAVVAVIVTIVSVFAFTDLQTTGGG